MSIFLCISQRYLDALKTFDPLKGEWLLGIIDPWQRGKEKGALSWWWIILTFLIAAGPLFLLSAIPSITCGGSLQGKGSFLADVGILGICFYLATTLLLIPIMRRVLGEMFNELHLRGVIDSTITSFKPEKHCKRFSAFWSAGHAWTVIGAKSGS